MGVMTLRRLITPVDDLLKAAEQVGQGDYSVRVPEKGPREVRSLARAFNTMASCLHIIERTTPGTAGRCNPRTAHSTDGCAGQPGRHAGWRLPG